MEGCKSIKSCAFRGSEDCLPDEAKGSHTDGLKIRISGREDELVRQKQRHLDNDSLVLPYLEVISKVVPKICARTKSAIVIDVRAWGS